MSNKMTPFEIASNINSKTGELEAQEVGYDAFMINRVFSNTADTVFFANEMNIAWELDRDLQYDFYYFGLSKKKRFGQWNKNQDNQEDIKLVQEVYGYTYHKAKEALALLAPHLDSLRAEMNKGGR